MTQQPVTVQRARQILGAKAEHLTDSALASLLGSLYSVADVIIREVRNQKRRDILPRVQR